MKSDEVVIGPYIVRERSACSSYEHVEATGYAIEFSTPDRVHRLPIFRCGKYSFEMGNFSAYAVRNSDIPFEVTCFNFQVKELEGGPYITLSAFLAEMYQLHDGLTPIKRMFVDLAEALPFKDACRREINSEAYPLINEVETAGYAISSVMPYGRRIFVDFCWRVPTAVAQENPRLIGLGSAAFRPRPDKRLDTGKWMPFRKHFVESLLWSELRGFGEGKPLVVLAEVTQVRILSEFDWTPLALMTSKQAREARIQFVRANRQLISDTKLLARALKQAHLYSDDTSVSQIRKFLPSLLMAAQVDREFS